MANNLLQTGFNLASYLDNTFPENDDGDDMYAGNGAGQSAEPPLLLKTWFQAGRSYFKLNYQDLLANIKFAFVPIGQAHALYPDLYIPVTALATYILLYALGYRKEKQLLNEAISSRCTRVLLVIAIEMILLTGLSYATKPISGLLFQQRQNSPQRHSQQYRHGNMGQFNRGLPHEYEFSKGDVGRTQSPRTNSNVATFGTCKKLFVIGYKYLLLNVYLIVYRMFPWLVTRIILYIYVLGCAAAFSFRALTAIQQQAKAVPLVFIFAILEVVFGYILLP